MLNNVLGIDFQNTFARDLEGLYKKGNSCKCSSAEVLLLNKSLSLELGIDLNRLQSKMH